jgi:hypothetical protein
MIAFGLTNHRAWVLALIIGVVAAVAVAALLGMLMRATSDIRRSVGQLLERAGQVAANTSNIPQLEATAPVLGQIVDEAIVQDAYMNALTDGYGGAPAPAAAAAPAATEGGGS